MSSYSEQEIILGCQENNRIFQEHLYRLYYSLFLKICVRYAKNMEDAEQLLNDGFLKIFKNIKSFKQAGSFEGWMKRIIVNVCLDYLKSKQLKDSLQISFPENISEDLQYSGSMEALKQMEFKELLHMIQKLPVMSKTVFNLYVFEGYSHKEIGQMLKVNESTSSWHLHHARNTLQKRIKSVNAGEPLYERK